MGAPALPYLSPALAGAAIRREGLAELEAVGWRHVVDAAWLRRMGRLWTAWTAAVVVVFAAPAVVLVAIQPWLFPVSLWSLAHGWAICELYARRWVTPLRDALRRSARPAAERMALGLLGDLVAHDVREIARETGVAIQRGDLGTWVIGQGGALMVRPGGRRTDCWCVRVKEPEGLPAADRVAHLLLALREDECGFATVANLGFSGATWRVRRRLPAELQPALDAARRMARIE